MQTRIIPILLLTVVAACEPERAQTDSRPDFDRVEFVAFDDTDTTDEGDAEETGDAGMDGVEPTEGNAEETGDDGTDVVDPTEGNDEETGDTGTDGVDPLPDMPAPDLLEGCCVCVDGLPVCEIWPSSPPLPACIGIFSSQCEISDGELLCAVNCG